MSLRFVGFVLCAAAALPVFGRELRVCADPDSMPYSRQDESGFENRLAALAADALGATLVYTWHPQHRGFVRATVDANRCDVWMGVPTGFRGMLTTNPYYRSTYVFVFSDRKPLVSFDQPNLKELRIGLQIPGDDLVATPPGYALASRGAADNVSAFTVLGKGSSAERIVDAIADGRLDAGVVWGPQAAFFARQRHLEIVPAAAPADVPLPFAYSISIGVKAGETALRDSLDEVIASRRGEINRILAEYAVPMLR
ncbi:MAG TPA: quinoprotein dehydrogenase-associated putative ABC transporter substrate-binding protein [Burkholderiales bacterium]|jgi:mxaJ protein